MFVCKSSRNREAGGGFAPALQAVVVDCPLEIDGIGAAEGNFGGVRIKHPAPVAVCGDFFHAVLYGGEFAAFVVAGFVGIEYDLVTVGHGVYLSFGKIKQGKQAGKSSIRRMVYDGIYNQTVKELCGAVAIILIHKHIFKNLFIGTGQNFAGFDKVFAGYFFSRRFIVFDMFRFKIRIIRQVRIAGNIKIILNATFGR